MIWRIFKPLVLFKDGSRLGILKVGDDGNDRSDNEAAAFTQAFSMEHSSLFAIDAAVMDCPVLAARRWNDSGSGKLGFKS